MSFVLHVVTDRSRQPLPLADAVMASLRGGADVVQLREKRAPALEIYHLCRLLQAQCEAAGLTLPLVINDRLDVALAIGAAGVHLAAKSLPIEAARNVAQSAGWPGLIGCSVHSLEAARAAAAAGADYITFGHVYASESHPGVPPRGVRELARIVEAVDVPVIAIGGIDVYNVEPVLETGCAGIAVIGAVIGQTDPAAAAARLKNAMAKVRAKPKRPFPPAPSARVPGPKGESS
jgi:thiamine-phosphate diphosphorylase